MKVSFGGIYDIKFPAKTTDKEFNKKYNGFKNFLDEQQHYAMVMEVNKYNDAKVIRMISTVDNPYMIADALSYFDKDLAEQYVSKSKIELKLDKLA